ncbi:MAG: FAD binding domain-containing protein [Anaerolineae bacterium]|uniref:FAD binding domain-containing protein n=1 Tax=Candidatus Amarolinea dominans TaxID=3140696 RepID=UPI003135C23B|nr:FAD binding domain-containing protein [Anaerolineae bacterium]
MNGRQPLPQTGYPGRRACHGRGDIRGTIRVYQTILPAEASAILAAEGSAARILQGGTDLIIRMRGDFIHPKIVVDLKGLPGMRDVAFNPDDGLILGAAVTMNEVATHPAILAHYRMLADACETVGSYQLRNRATIGGNVCNASPAGDSIPALLCYDATAVIYNPAETDDLAVDAAAAAVMNACRPIDDVRQRAYRQAMVRVLARRAIEAVLAHLPFRATKRGILWHIL